MKRERIIGNHLYEKCKCGKWVRMTGWFSGLHLCLTDEEINNLNQRGYFWDGERWGNIQSR